MSHTRMHAERAPRASCASGGAPLGSANARPTARAVSATIGRRSCAAPSSRIGPGCVPGAARGRTRARRSSLPPRSPGRPPSRPACADGRSPCRGRPVRAFRLPLRTASRQSCSARAVRNPAPAGIRALCTIVKREFVNRARLREHGGLGEGCVPRRESRRVCGACARLTISPMHIQLDPVGGIAGDMFAAAVLDAWPELESPLVRPSSARGSTPSPPSSASTTATTH